MRLKCKWPGSGWLGMVNIIFLKLLEITRVIEFFLHTFWHHEGFGCMIFEEIQLWGFFCAFKRQFSEGFKESWVNGILINFRLP